MTYILRIEQLGREVLVEEGFETKELVEKRLRDIQELQRRYECDFDPFITEFFIEEE